MQFDPEHVECSGNSVYLNEERFRRYWNQIGVLVHAGIHYSEKSNYAHFVKVIARITKVHATRR